MIGEFIEQEFRDSFLRNSNGADRELITTRYFPTLATTIVSVTPFDMPLAESEITRERLSLEEAIRTIEATTTQRDRASLSAEAVEALEPEQGPSDAPVLRSDEVLHPQRIHGAVDEQGERAAPFWDEACHAMQRLAVDEIAVEIEVGLAIMAQRDEVPGHAGQPLDLLIGCLAVDRLARDGVCFGEACGPDLEIGPVSLIFAFQTLE